jgi:hypothetical protein
MINIQLELVSYLVLFLLSDSLRHEILWYFLGRAMAQAVSRRPLTA